MELHKPGESPRRRSVRNGLIAWLGAFCLAVAATPQALALSEIKREELPAPPAPSVPGEDNPEKTVPLPDPIQPPAETPEAEQPAITPPEATEPDGTAAPDGAETPEEEANAPLPEILYDLEKLPPDVKRMRDLIIDACKSGDIEKLRPLIGLGDDTTQLSLGGMDGDPIEFLKGLSGDKEGQEILAIMEEVLSAGYVHLDAGTAEDLYVWPYFFAVPLDKLDARQHVELFKIVTAGDYDDMKNYGSYIFYRVGITPQGRWAFFVAGE